MAPAISEAAPAAQALAGASGRLRADMAVVAQGLAETRSRAQALILAGSVLDAQGTCIDKAGASLPADCQLHLRGNPLPYVSRGGLKLAAALEAFAPQLAQGALCLDVGASTGGFTDCLLQRGARRVVALDVGRNQLAYALRQNPRVQVLEQLNIRHASRAQLPEPFDLIVVDVSFISLHTVLPALLPFAGAHAGLVALIKPQFEVGRAHVGRGGVVRNVEARRAALQGVLRLAEQLGLTEIGSMDSPIVGAKGNHEYLLYARVPHGAAAP